MEEWEEDFLGIFAWLSTQQCHNQLYDNYGDDGGRREVLGPVQFFVFIMAVLSAVDAPPPPPPLTTTTTTTMMTTTTTTVKLIVFKYNINTSNWNNSHDSRHTDAYCIT
jgi:hypothetical protein